VELSTRFRVLLGHARRFETIVGRDRFPRLRKHLGWYCKGFPHAAALRASMVRASSSEDVRRLLAEYLDGQASASTAAANLDRTAPAAALLHDT
ncbi:MAG: hypothetical protein ACE5NA_03100, partial [Nitrospiraceae bacterium]